MYKYQVTAFAITRVGCLEKDVFNISVLRSKSFWPPKRHKNTSPGLHQYLRHTKIAAPWTLEHPKSFQRVSSSASSTRSQKAPLHNKSRRQNNQYQRVKKGTNGCRNPESHACLCCLTSSFGPVCSYLTATNKFLHPHLCSR